MGNGVEKGEMDATVGAHLLEMGMGREVVVGTMLEDEQSVGSEEGTGEDEVGQLGQPLEGVGWVGKNNVERSGNASEVAEHIGLNRMPGGVGKLMAYLINIGVVGEVPLHGNHLAAAARQELEADAARAGKEVEHSPYLVEVEAVGKDVEEVFLGEVGGGTGLEGLGNVEATVAVLSSYNTQKN